MASKTEETPQKEEMLEMEGPETLPDSPLLGLSDGAVDDVHAQFNALVADKYGRTGDELAHLVLALAAERAMEAVSWFRRR